ncbi:FimV/HubP family polar landmark protein [Comamonas composti]|uniref:FimV/HubP family polar landmark protein n=1 Tax=Comamonas composti TaxID=408558 RepID=UPI0004283B50|nr:FimV/HubP family polar landmark protein [Comamonas composti]
MQRWKLSALATAAIVSVGLTGTNAWALALGQLTVQSALGEPLRAEIALPQLSASEAESLQASIAPPSVFSAQGVEYSSAAASMRVNILRRPDGSAVLKLSSSKPVNDPFIDLVIDANWASGSLQRSYTMLLDPPAARRPAPAISAQAQASAPESAPAPRRPAAPSASASQPPASAEPVATQPTPVERPAVTQAQPSPGEVHVQRGDTAGRIAAAHRPAGVSLDQMLVAMLRANPQAFINGNVNRMRSGAVISLPDESAAKSTSAREARQIVSAQARDFNQFRRQLAAAAPQAPVAAASREASGGVQAQVEENRQAGTSPDKLTLSKGGIKSAQSEESLAQKKQAEDQNSRMAELQRNMSELTQIASASTPAEGTPVEPSPAPAASAPATDEASAPAPATDENTGPAVPSASGEAGSVPADTQEPAQEQAAEPAAPEPAPKPKLTPPPEPVEEPSFIDSLLEDPMIPLAGAALLALLLGYGGYRVVQRRRAAAAGGESGFGDSQLAADSFFGASGGQRVDTGASSQLSGNSMHYTPSQLDAGDVDPLAEADVYLAYGRDLQAEEILKEALRTTPERLALHQKLADIYVKRHDRKAFEALAQTLHGLTSGQGAEWQRLTEQGRILDPENPLYQPGGMPFVAGSTTTAAIANDSVGFASTLSPQTRAMPESSDAEKREGPATMPMDLDLDLDMDLPGGLADASLPKPQASPSSPMPAPSEQDFAALEPSWHSTDMVNLPTQHAPLSSAAPAASLPPESKPAHENDFMPSSGLEFNLDEPASAAMSAVASAELKLDPAEPAPAQTAEQKQSLEFDLGDLALDLGDTEPAKTPAPTPPEDLLATKLALAQEFSTIGDNDGARTLIEEVIAEAHGDLKARAQRLLSEIG